MEMILVALLPIVLLLVGLGLATGRTQTPEQVTRAILSLAWKVLGMLWRHNPERRGAGKMKRPRIRYRR